MALRIISADERLSTDRDKVTIAVFGRAKVGKTTLVSTLPHDKTLFVNFEAGMKSVQGYRGDTIDIRTWEDAQDIACLIGGVDPGAFNGKINAKRDGWEVGPAPFCQLHYQTAQLKYAALNLAKYRYTFWDSISYLTTLCMAWAKVQPSAFSEKTGRPDTRGAYGILAFEVVKLLKHVQHAQGINVIFVGGLLQETDEFNRESFRAQSEGARIAAEVPYIVDQILTLSDFDVDPTTGAPVHNLGKGKHRALCCSSPNPWGLPAGDRSGNLNMIEPPNLWALIQKINKR